MLLNLIHEEVIELRVLFHLLVPCRAAECLIDGLDVVEVIESERYCTRLQQELWRVTHLHVDFRSDPDLSAVH